MIRPLIEYSYSYGGVPAPTSTKPDDNTDAAPARHGVASLAAVATLASLLV